MRCYLYDLGCLAEEEEEEEEGEKSRAYAYKVFCGSGLNAECIEGVMIPGLNY